MKLKIIPNPDKEIVKEVISKLKETGGQCPCVLPPFWNDDTKCKCKNFREQDYEGECCCGLFVKVIDDEEP